MHGNAGTTVAAPEASASCEIRVDADTQIYVEQRGAGPDVMLVNNIFMDAASWRHHTARLTGGCRVITYDLRGQSASTGDLAATWDTHVADAAAVLDGVGAAEVVLVGTSLSALLCRDIALAFPDRIRGLVLAGPALSPWGMRRHRAILRTWLRTLEDSGLPALYDQMYPLVSSDHAAERAGMPGFLGRKQSFLGLNTPEWIRAGIAVSLTAPADPALLARIACPTLLVVGDDDFALGASAVDELVALFSDARAIILPRAGHLPFIEEPERFQDEVAAFVAGITAGSRG
jgi:pimeloyl-ACP methyl ester carboxylesterase